MNFEELLNTTTDVDILTTLILSLESLNDKSSKNDLKYNVKEKPIHEIYNEGIEKYIEAPCVNACKKLWDKNMFTKNLSQFAAGFYISPLYSSASVSSG